MLGTDLNVLRMFLIFFCEVDTTIVFNRHLRSRTPRYPPPPKLSLFKLHPVGYTSQKFTSHLYCVSFFVVLLLIYFPITIDMQYYVT